jgi:ATP-binding cassette, subfamily C, bacterial CydC
MPDLQPMTAQHAWRALRPFLLRSSGATPWLLGGLFLGVLAALGGLGLLGLSGAFLTGAAMAGVSATTALAFNFFLPGAGVRFFSIVRTTSRWGERVVSHEGTFRWLSALRVWLYRRLSLLSPRQLMGYHGADLLNRLVRDIDALDNLHPRFLMPMAGALIVLSLMALLFFNWSPVLLWVPGLLMAIVLVGLPVMGWVLSSPLLTAWTQHRSDLRLALVDLVDGLEDLCLQREAWAAQKRRILLTERAWFAAHLSAQRRVAGARALVSLLVGLAAWGSLALLTDSSSACRVPAPAAAALVLLILGCAEVLLPLVGACFELPGTACAAQRVQSLAEQAPSIEFPISGQVPQHSGIELSGVHFEWDMGQAVLRDLNLVVRPGEHILLTGESGAGKSTLIQLLARVERPTQGRICLGNVEIEALTEAELRTQVSCLLQFTWAQTATLADNLRLAKHDATLDEMHDVLSLVGLEPEAAGWPDGLETWIDEGGGNLSGGQRRRLGVAMALLRRAPITLLDEPSEGLDDAAQAELTDRITAHLEGRTLIWVSHRAGQVAAFDRVVHLTAGHP